MAGRLVDYIGHGTAAALPSAATVDGDLTAGAAGFYYAYDVSTLYALNRNGTPAWETVGGGGSTTTVNEETGTTYTFVLADAETVVEFNNASAITVTIPPNSSVAFPVGTWIELHQKGAGTLTVAAGSGVTLQSRGSLTDTAGQYAIAGIRKVATDTWRLTGDLT